MIFRVLGDFLNQVFGGPETIFWGFGERKKQTFFLFFPIIFLYFPGCFFLKAIFGILLALLNLP